MPNTALEDVGDGKEITAKPIRDALQRYRRHLGLLLRGRPFVGKLASV